MYLSKDPDDEARQQSGFFTWGIKGTYGCPVLQETVWLPLIATCREHLSTPLLLLLSLFLPLGIRAAQNTPDPAWAGSRQVTGNQGEEEEHPCCPLAPGTLLVERLGVGGLSALP